MKTCFYNVDLTSPKVTFILLDWDCRESFHSLDYLAQQDVPRADYEIIWIEYYDRQASEIDRRLEEAQAQGKSPPIDNWIVMEMPKDLYYHKHLMYNIGIAQARGEIVVICDSDAMFEPSFVRTVLDSFAADPNLALHIDEIRSHRRDFYPFNYPSFDDVKGEGVINWRDGKTTGVWDTVDPLHTRNYGACLCAWRSDLVEIGGSDECLDYLGHVCGPYELTFRLRNLGRREMWHETHYIYHTWHPGSDGDLNYIGPNDGMNMSTTALEALKGGRLLPLKENEAIRLERTRSGLDREERLKRLIDPEYVQIWTKEAVAASPNFTLFSRQDGAPKLVGEDGPCNLISFGRYIWTVPRYLGAVDFSNAAELRDPRIRSAETIEAATSLIDAVESEARQLFGHDADHELLNWRDEWIAFPRSLGRIDLNDERALQRPEVLRAATREELGVLAAKARLGKLGEAAASVGRELIKLWEIKPATWPKTSAPAVDQNDEEATLSTIVAKLDQLIRDAQSMNYRIEHISSATEGALLAVGELQNRQKKIELMADQIANNRKGFGLVRMLRSLGLVS